MTSLWRCIGRPASKRDEKVQLALRKKAGDCQRRALAHEISPLSRLIVSSHRFSELASPSARSLVSSTLSSRRRSANLWLETEEIRGVLEKKKKSGGKKLLDRREEASCTHNRRARDAGLDMETEEEELNVNQSSSRDGLETVTRNLGFATYDPQKTSYPWLIPRASTKKCL